MDTGQKRKDMILWAQRVPEMTKKRKSPSIVVEKTQSGEPSKASDTNETTTSSDLSSLDHVPAFEGPKVDLESEVEKPNEPDVMGTDKVEIGDAPAKPFWKRKESPAPPVYETSDLDHLAKVDITKRRGNYILAVGLPESGKTTLQSFMTYFLKVGANFDTQLDVVEENGDINHQAQYLVTNWLEQWKIGKFPDSTPVGEDEIREIRLDVKNTQNKRQEFNLSFLEISGENFASIVPNSTQVPTLFVRLREFLENKKINLNIVLVLKSDQTLKTVSDDALFDNFFVFLTNQLKLKLDRFGLIILVPNPQIIFPGDNWNLAKTDQSLFQKTMLDHIYKTCPTTYKTYKSWNEKRKCILPLHIGDSSDDKLTKRDFRDVNLFVRKNYTFFTGGPLKSSFWRRMMGKDMS